MVFLTSAAGAASREQLLESSASDSGLRSIQVPWVSEATSNQRDAEPSLRLQFAMQDMQHLEKDSHELHAR